MRAHFSKTLTDNAGNVLLNASVRVLQPGSTLPISQPIYSDNNSTNTLPNPFVCSTGVIDFYLNAAQRVRIGITPSGDSTEVYFEDIDVSAVAFLAAVLDEGTAVPFRPSLNFVGTGVTILDDSTTNSTIVSVGPSDVPDAPRWVRRVVAAHNAPNEEKNGADYVCDGINDEEQINQAIADIDPGGKIQWGSYGGEVVLGAGEFVIGNGVTNNEGSIKIRSGVHLRGAGTRATWIRAAGIDDINGAFSTFTASTVQDVPSVVFGAHILNVNSGAGMIEFNSPDVEFSEVNDLSLFGNSRRGARTLGIRYDTNPLTDKLALEGSDAANRLQDLYIAETAGHGIYHDGVIGHALKANMIRIFRVGTTVEANACGILARNPGAWYANIDINGCTNHGIWAAAGNNQWINTRASFSGSGQMVPGTYGASSGIWITGKRNTFSGIVADNNHGHGIAILDTDNTLTSFLALSNGWAGGFGSGILVGGDRCSLFGNSLDPATERPREQRYGVDVRTGTTQATGMITTSQNTLGPYTGNMAFPTMQLLISELDNPAKAFFRLPSRVYQGIPKTAPANSDMSNSTLSMWLDETNNKLMFKVRRSTGAYQQGSIGVV
jgi:hypothetical protein